MVKDSENGNNFVQNIPSDKTAVAVRIVRSHGRQLQIAETIGVQIVVAIPVADQPSLDLIEVHHPLLRLPAVAIFDTIRYRAQERDRLVLRSEFLDRLILKFGEFYRQFFITKKRLA